jgi:hypothetical protein
MATTEAPFTVSPLLALPGEIRTLIYGYLFAGIEVSANGGHRYCRCSTDVRVRLFPWQITASCRKLRHEAMPLLLASTTLHICATGREMPPPLPPSYLSTIPHLVTLSKGTCWNPDYSPELFGGIKTLEIRNIIVWCKYHEDAYLLQPEADECMHSLVLVGLNRINPKLACMCLDPNLPFKTLLCCQFVVSSGTHEATIVSNS